MKKYVGITLLLCISFVFGFNYLCKPNNNIKQENYDMSKMNGEITILGSIASLDMQDLVCNSVVIVQGKVSGKSKSKWSNEGFKRGKDIRNILQTDIIIDVDKVFNGKPYDVKQIAIRVDKGQTDNLVVISDGYPDFDIGEDVVLFLSTDDSDVANNQEQYYVLTGMRQGKFAQISGSTKYASDKETFDINELNDIIKENLEKEKKNPRKKMTKDEIKKANEALFGN